MEAILRSAKPEDAEKILRGEKTIEVLKNAPNDWLDYLSGKTKVKPEPRTVYIYCTKGKNNALISFEEYKGSETFTSYDCICGKFKSEVMRTHGYDDVLDGKVIAKYTLREVGEIEYLNTYGWKGTCLTLRELVDYGKGKILFGWHISDLEIFDEPKNIWEFEHVGGYRSVNKCPKKERGLCNMGYGARGYSGCDKARLKRPPRSWCYVEKLQ